MIILNLPVSFQPLIVNLISFFNRQRKQVMLSPVRRFSRQRLSRLGVCMSIALTGALPQTVSWAADVATPPHGGTMVIALSSNPSSLNSARAVGVAVALPALQVTEGLVRVDRNNSPQPELATSWTVSKDGKVITFKLRDGVKWHDGQPFTSADVKYTFDKLAPLHPRASGVFKNVQSVEVPDPLTVVVTLKQSYGPFIDFLTADNAGIQPKHLYDGRDPMNNPFNRRPVGTGPFMFSSWTPGQSIVLTRNPNYWDKGKPYLDKLIFQIMPDANSRVAALEAGDIDYIANYDMSISALQRLRLNPTVAIGSNRGVARPLLLMFNTKNPTLSNAAVRHALYEAIDRNLLIATAFSGLGKPGVSSISPSFQWAYNPAVDYTKMYAYSADKAAKDLDAAGFKVKPDGTRFTVRMTYEPSVSGYTETAQVIRDNWKKIGVNAVLEPRETNVWLSKVYTDKDFDTAFAIYNSGGDPALGVDRMYRCAPPKTINNNASQYCNPQLDALYDKAAAPFDKAERATYYKETQTIVANDLPTAVIADLGYADATRRAYGGLAAAFADRGDINIHFDEIYRSK
jgi:peptide/nickel transport system substrate-binding protein